MKKMSNQMKKSAAERIQYAALPFRRSADFEVEVMLVTSRETGRWVIPKGWPIRRKAPHASAAREALEEAGVVGAVGREPIGTYSYEKRMSKGVVVVCEVRVFPLEVKRQMKGWPEKEERTCCWFSPTEAAQAVHEPDLGDIILSMPGLPNSKQFR
jgi:8-oxo-dGTP pyrophosphatase MutT (NUDIX family)